MNKLWRRVLGVALAVVGAVWLLQGISVLPGSFMSGSTLWATIGLVLLLVGIWLVVSRESPGAPHR